MAIMRRLVLSMDTRATVAVLAIAISVSYSLVAGSAVTGLSDAQETMPVLEDASLVAVHPEEDSLDLDDLPRPPDRALATHEHEAWTLYAVHSGAPLEIEHDEVLAGPATGLEDGQRLELHGDPYTVVTPGDGVWIAPGALPSWIGAPPETLEALGAETPLPAHIVAYEDANDALKQDLQQAGLSVHEAPSGFGFYEAGSQQVVSAVHLTVVASALVVGLITAGFINMELRARQPSYATLQSMAGPTLVQRTVTARGAFLLTTGHLVGTAATIGLLSLLSNVGSLTLGFSWTFALLALAATFGGGLLGLASPVLKAPQRLTADELADPAVDEDRPRALRFIFTSWSTTVPLVASAIVLAASLGMVYGVADVPEQLFEGGDSQVVADTSVNPLRGEVPAFLGHHLGDVDGYQASSPEIFAPTLVDDEPLMARGVSWEHVERINDATIQQGRTFQSPNEAVLGQQAARTLDRTIGDTLHLPSPYHAGIARVTIVGTASLDGLLNDEILLPLETARSLTGLPPDAVNMIRYETTPNQEPRTLPTGIEVTGLTLDPPNPVPHEQATVHLDLANFAPGTDTRQLTLQANGQHAASDWVRLPGHATETTTLAFRAPPQQSLTLTVNPQLDARTEDPGYRLDAPDVASINKTLTVTVTTPEGDPAPAVNVTLDDATARTDDQGHATLTPRTLGNRSLIAQGEQGRAGASIQVVDPADLHRPRLVIHTVSGPTNVEPGTWNGIVDVENAGGAPFQGPLPLRVNDEQRHLNTTHLAPGDRDHITITLDLDEGSHRIGPHHASLTVQAQQAPPQPPGDGQDPDEPPPPEQGTFEALLEQRREETQQTSTQDADPTQSFLEDTFENIGAALNLITLITILHAGLITFVAVYREIEERANRLGTVTAIGSSRTTLRRIVAREYATVGTAAAVPGVLLGLGGMWLLGQAGMLNGFGHTLSPRLGLAFALALILAAVATTLLAAMLTIEHLQNRSSRHLMIQGPSRTRRPGLSAFVGEPP